MRRTVMLIALALAANAQAADGAAVGHRSDGNAAEARPMSWPYAMLQTARAVFDERMPAQAPGASLRFRLPKVDPAEPGNRVELVTQAHRHALPLVSHAAFALPPAAEVAAEAADGGAVVVVDRYFPKGDYNHPNVEVRSPDLPQGVRRVGDLRLACAAQMAMAKTEGFKERALLAAVSLFGFNICEKLELAKFDAPRGAWDSATIEDGEQRLVLPKLQREGPQLGDKAWSDNARISYTMGGRPVL